MTAIPTTPAVYRSAREQGFTILEILLAVAILTLGLLGILALFPVAIESGKTSIEKTNAVLIAQSVEQAIREGLQHRKGQAKDGRFTYFIFQHDGVKDPVPRLRTEAKSSEDYFILLPESGTDRNAAPQPRLKAYEAGKVFVYPETDGLSWTAKFEDGFEQELSDESGSLPNGGGNPVKADDDADDNEDGDNFEVLRTYQLGSEMLPEGYDQYDYTEEQLDAIAAMRGYSFAFSIRRAFNDSSLGLHAPVSLPTEPSTAKQDHLIIPGNELFEVTVMVYRSFRPKIPDLKPIYTSRFLVHK